VYASTAEEAAALQIARQNSITSAACWQACNNPATLVSVDPIGLTFVARSLCTGILYTLPLASRPSPKQPPPDSDDNPVEGCGESNPCSPTTGQKYQVEPDFGAPTLRYVRRYNSHALERMREFTGAKWRSNFEKSINLVDDTGLSIGILTHPIAFVRRETGQEIRFELIGGAWVSDPDITGILDQTPTGWTYRAEANLVETYDLDGRLISQTDELGRETTLVYDTLHRLETVTGPFGRTLSFTHDALDRVRTLTDPEGNVYTYEYDGSHTLISVTSPYDKPAADTDNPVRRYHYEEPAFPSHLTGITDENGVRFASWTYDAKGRAVSAERAGGVGRVDFVFNSDGTTTVTDARGAVRTYGLDTQFGVEKPVSVSGDQCTTCGNKASAASYDANGFLSSQTDFSGNVTDIVKDARGLEVSRTEAVGTPAERTVTTQWHPDFRLPLFISQPGKRTAFTYDSVGRLLSRTETDISAGRTRTVTNSYTPEGLMATIDGGRTDTSDVTVFAYDLQGKLTTMTNALGHQSIVTSHDANGRPLTMEDANGLLTTLAYDARGRLISRDVGSQITLLDYDGAGNVTKATLPDGSFLLSEYDDAQRLIALEDNLGHRAEFTLDAMGNRIGEIIRNDGGSITRTRSRVFNLLNSVTRETGGGVQLTDFEYDLQGNVVALVDGNNERSTYAYDGLNRLARSVDPGLGETDFAYDARDNLVSITDAESLVTTYAYDGLENLFSQLSPDTGATKFTHDDAGNRISGTDARGVIVNYTYDALNRLESIRFPDTTKDVDIEYDVGPNGVGRLTRMSDESGSTDFVYDLRGNLLSEIRTIDSVPYSTAYTYDIADRVVTITYPGGTLITYIRDSLGRIDSVSATIDGNTRILASNIRYLPFGPIRGYDFGNGIVLDRGHDQDYRLTDYTAGGVQDVSIGYDPANNITSLTDGLDASRSQSFTYDPLNRLNHAKGVYGTQDFTYDAIGNRLSLDAAAGLDAYDYALNSHHLQTISGPNATTFTYDAAGNTTAKGPLSFTYDDTNRMSEAGASGIVVGKYVYNGRGERVEKAAGGRTTVYHYDAQGQLIAESDETGATLREYVYLEGAPLALLTPTGSGGIEVIVDNTDPGFDAFSDWESKSNGIGAVGGEYVRQRINGPASGGILADDSTATLTGRWKQRSNKNAIGSDFHRAKAGPGDATATWSIAVPTPGDYRVYATWRSIKGVASDVPYTIAHTGGMTTLVVDQTQNNNTWVELGVFSFAAETISISLQNTPTGKATADAIYVVDARATAGHRATWKLDAPVSGDYEVYVRWPAGVPGAARKAEFTVDHDGGSDIFIVNQRDDGNQWNSLGVFSFAAGTGEVILGDDGHRRHALADAVRIVKTGSLGGPARVSYYHNDHLGTPKRMTDDDRSVVWAADSWPFGETMLSVTTVPNNLRFPGHYSDEESGLHYNYFRFYDPSTGRYLRSDPAGLIGGLNTFLYANANSLRFFDKFGLVGIGPGPGIPEPFPSGTPLEGSVGLEAYFIVGGGVNIAVSEGTLEFTGRLGLGFGGGLSFDPDGGPSPHSKSCGSGYIARTTVDGSIGVGVGQVGVGGGFKIASGNAVTTPIGGGYVLGTDSVLFGDNRSIGIKLGASVGVDIGSYSNW